jgi:hypothetical protein
MNKLHRFFRSQNASFTIESSLVIPVMFCTTHLFLMISFQLFVTNSHFLQSIARVEQVVANSSEQPPRECDTYQDQTLFHKRTVRCSAQISFWNRSEIIIVTRYQPQRLIRMIDIVMTNQGTVQTMMKP